MEQLRCICRESPLLAMCGSDERTGEPIVHIKYAQNGFVQVETIVTSGVVRIRCRSCTRWYRVKIVGGTPGLRSDGVVKLRSQKDL